MDERRIRFDERAANDVRAAVEWYGEQQSNLGQEFVTELDACMQRCVRYPDLHQAVASSDIRRALLVSSDPTRRGNWLDAVDDDVD